MKYGVRIVVEKEQSEIIMEVSVIAFSAASASNSYCFGMVSWE